MANAVNSPVLFDFLLYSSSNNNCCSSGILASAVLTVAGRRFEMLGDTAIDIALNPYGQAGCSNLFLIQKVRYILRLSI